MTRDLGKGRAKLFQTSLGYRCPEGGYLSAPASSFEFIRIYVLFFAFLFDDPRKCPTASLMFQLVNSFFFSIFQDVIDEITASEYAFVKFFFESASPSRKNLRPAALASNEPATGKFR